MAVFQESGDAGATIDEAAGIISIPEFDTIEGSFSSSTGDVDLYELQLDSDVRVDVELSDETNPLALLDSQGNIVSSGDDNTLSFDGEAGETFFLQVGRELEDGEVALTVITEYEVTLDLNEDISDRDKDRQDDFVDKCAFDTQEYDPFSGFKDNVFFTDRIGIFDESLAFDFVSTNYFAVGSVSQVSYGALDSLIQVELYNDGNAIVDIEIASFLNFSWLLENSFIF